MRVLNRHTVQLSYRTMPSLSKIIAANNIKVLSEDRLFEVVEVEDLGKAAELQPLHQQLQALFT